MLRRASSGVVETGTRHHGMAATLADLTQAAEAREQEWRAAERARATALVAELEQKEEQLSRLQQQFSVLKDDFRCDASAVEQ